MDHVRVRRNIVIDAFDFDKWAALAKAAPDEFEVRRSDFIEKIISNHSHAPHLRGLQWRIDMERKRAHTIIQSYLKISSIMWDSFAAFRDTLERPLSKPCQQAKIIQFCRKD